MSIRTKVKYLIEDPLDLASRMASELRVPRHIVRNKQGNICLPIADNISIFINEKAIGIAMDNKKGGYWEAIVAHAEDLEGVTTRILSQLIRKSVLRQKGGPKAKAERWRHA